MSMIIIRRATSLVLIALFVGLSACNPANIKRNTNLEDSLMHYKVLMNRSNFIGAARFRLPTARWDTRGLERYQLSHYEVKQSEGKDGGNKLERTVFLRYIDRHSMRERSTLYKEIWVYNAKSKQWQLDGEPPVFR